jgi:hypothetical protein
MKSAIRILILLLFFSIPTFAQSEDEKSPDIAVYEEEMTNILINTLNVFQLAEEAYYSNYNKYTDNFDDLKRFDFKFDGNLEYSKITLSETSFQRYPTYRISVIDKKHTIAYTCDSSLEKPIQRESYYKYWP